ncbi:class I SAM-dependent methyltransferase [Flavobacteriaceae bacterium LMO-SS05]
MKLQNNIAEEFNEFSKNYTNDMVKVVPNYLKLLEHFTQDISLGFNPKHILDLGCGNGIITSKLLPLFPNSHYTLLDASDKMLEICEAQFGVQHSTYVQSYFQDYEFKKNQFDMVVAGFSIHHCNAKDKQKLYKAIYRSLTPNGMFMCSDLMVERNTKEHDTLVELWKTFVNKNPTDQETWDWLMDHYQAYDHPNGLDKQLKWLRQAGFTDFKISIYDAYWVHLKAIKALG